MLKSEKIWEHEMKAVNLEHAYNYWRKAFLESSEGHFTKDQFEAWFRSKAGKNPLPLLHIGVPDRLGTPEHFDMSMRTSFKSMLEACADGRFS